MKKTVAVLFVCLLFVTVSAFGEDLVPGTSIIVPEKTFVLFGYDIPVGAYTISCVDGDEECTLTLYYLIPPEQKVIYATSTQDSSFKYTRYFLENYLIGAGTRIKITVAEPFVFK